MVCRLTCDCDKFDITNEYELNSIRKQEQYEAFFSRNVKMGIFTEEMPDTPYYTYHSFIYYADKWYRCKVCGCLWEYVEPNFPSCGFVRKFADGRYFDIYKEI